MSLTEHHNFSGALATWKGINLHELQKTLDAQGIEIVENQKENVLSRKGLAERTKEFKKIPDDEKLNAFKVLLKAYQQEIDNLTKRSKVAESAFLNVYKVLAEAPDPYPLLETVVEQTITSETNVSLTAEVNALKAEVARLRGENVELKRENGTLDSMKRKVETLEGKMDELIAEKVSQKENELNATYDERMRNYEEREQDLTRQVTLYKSQLRELRLSNETHQARLLDASSRADQDLVSRLAEADMVLADLERASSRVAAVEGRNEELRAEIETLRAGSENTELITSLQSRLSALESTNTDLTAQLFSTQSQLSVTQTQLSRHVEEGAKREKREKAELQMEVGALKRKLLTYADYDEIKRELEIMKYVEFGGLDDDTSDVDGDDWSSHESEGVHLPDPNADKANAQHGKSLEVLLASKNKRILEELTRFRILHTTLEESLKSTQSELDAARTELFKQKSLNEKLETDLLAIDKRSTNPPSMGGTSVDDALAGLGLDLGLDNTKSKKGESSSSTTRSTPIPFTSSADTSILPIVTSQRDRFRARNAELEEELRRQFHTISELRSEIKSLQSDNLKLYEKVRYMQSYRETSSVSQLDPLPGSSRSHRTEKPRVGSVRDDGDDDEMELGKWRQRYEETMNPFEAFRGREATQAYTSLPLPERLLVTLTRAVLGHRRARLAFVSYATGLHLLVVWVVWSGWGCWGDGGSGVDGYVNVPRPF
ncbi:CASP C terminal-domain-containing protein [Boletus edulis BED1]|uniref:Protein CASP n=1 Tax=Boletus edulis BED1 TaxID=1328754 RepID=A0AAD4BX36_BOLED|nr:CASP C terminal-domain-containing protein [Boletus edulis BED1]